MITILKKHLQAFEFKRSQDALTYARDEVSSFNGELCAVSGSITWRRSQTESLVEAISRGEGDDVIKEELKSFDAGAMLSRGFTRTTLPHVYTALSTSKTLVMTQPCMSLASMSVNSVAVNKCYGVRDAMFKRRGCDRIGRPGLSSFTAPPNGMHHSDAQLEAEIKGLLNSQLPEIKLMSDHMSEAWENEDDLLSSARHQVMTEMRGWIDNMIDLGTDRVMDAAHGYTPRWRDETNELMRAITRVNPMTTKHAPLVRWEGTTEDTTKMESVRLFCDPFELKVVCADSALTGEFYPPMGSDFSSEGYKPRDARSKRNEGYVTYLRLKRHAICALQVVADSIDRHADALTRSMINQVFLEGRMSLSLSLAAFHVHRQLMSLHRSCTDMVIPGARPGQYVSIGRPTSLYTMSTIDNDGAMLSVWNDTIWCSSSLTKEAWQLTRNEAFSIVSMAIVNSLDDWLGNEDASEVYSDVISSLGRRELAYPPIIRQALVRANVYWIRPSRLQPLMASSIGFGPGGHRTRVPHLPLGVKILIASFIPYGALLCTGTMGQPSVTTAKIVGTVTEFGDEVVGAASLQFRSMLSRGRTPNGDMNDGSIKDRAKPRMPVDIIAANVRSMTAKKKHAFGMSALELSRESDEYINFDANTYEVVPGETNDLIGYSEFEDRDAHGSLAPTWYEEHSDDERDEADALASMHVHDWEAETMAEEWGDEPEYEQVD